MLWIHTSSGISPKNTGLKGSAGLDQKKTSYHLKIVGAIVQNLRHPGDVASAICALQR